MIDWFRIVLAVIVGTINAAFVAIFSDPTPDYVVAMTCIISVTIITYGSFDKE